MINIRRNCFETNSSSTHCLVMSFEDKDRRILSEEDKILQQEYIIYPFTEAEIKQPMEFKTLEEKLRWFWTAYLQGNDYHYSVIGTVQECCPNVIFTRKYNKESNFVYVFEDVEYYEEDIKWDYQTMKHFLLYGSIHYANRDREDHEDYIDDVKRGKFYVKWSG